MSPHIHRENGRDVEIVFRAYIDTTGDKSATLSREGATWTVSGQHLKGSYYGAREACAAIRHFIAGYNVGYLT
jgi:hypothetical protein